ncbi:MAG: XylR family transcriptional regulator [Pirellulales bacterium]
MKSDRSQSARHTLGGEGVRQALARRSSRRLLHIALLIETSREYGRGLLRGVARYHQKHGPWSVYFEPHGLNEPPPAWLKTWRGDGILARVDDWKTADMILETGLPAVDVRGALPEHPLPFVGIENHAVAQLGFEHLQQLGLQHFAFCGTPRGENPNQDIRCDAFVETVEATGRHCHVFLGGNCRNGAASWETIQKEIARWLQKLPKPIGIMTCHDDRGHQTLDACRRVGLHVPNDIAVVGVDNDTSVCGLCTPPLSSIDVNPGRVGYEAAALLMRLIEGEPAPRTPVYIGPPRGIVSRKSTDVFAINDDDVVAVLRFIHENACHGIQVSDAIKMVKNSPSTLERRVKAAIGRTIKAEIDRIRLQRAKLLLQMTQLPIATVAARSGFSVPKYFCDVFRKFEGMTATAYRSLFCE